MVALAPADPIVGGVVSMTVTEIVHGVLEQLFNVVTSLRTKVPLHVGPDVTVTVCPEPEIVAVPLTMVHV